ELLPLLIDALKTDEHPYSYPAIGLSRVEGPETVPALIDVLRNDPDKSVRAAAASALGLMGPRAKEAVPALREALRDEDTEVRGRSAQALEEIDPKAAGDGAR